MPDNKMIVFKPDTVILREGEVNEFMFKILKGHAEVYVGYGTTHESLLGIIGEQSCFGEFGLLLKKPAIYTVIAFDEIIAFRISEKDMDNFILENRKNVLDIMKNMANSMFTMRFQIELLMKDIEECTKSGNINLDEKREHLRRTLRQYAIGNAYGHGITPTGAGFSFDKTT